jgi:hypothetical protein
MVNFEKNICFDLQIFFYIRHALFAEIVMNVSTESACLSQAFGFWAVWKIQHKLGHFQRQACCAALFL